MPGSFVVGAEGVLLLPDSDSYSASRPIPEGLQLTTALSTAMGRFIVITQHPEPERVDFWCKVNGLKGADVHSVPAEDQHKTPEQAQWYEVLRVRSRGPLWVVLTAHAFVFEQCLASHQPALLFGRRGALGEVETPRPWQEIYDEIMAAKEARLEGGDEVLR